MFKCWSYPALEDTSSSTSSISIIINIIRISSTAIELSRCQQAPRLNTWPLISPVPLHCLPTLAPALTSANSNTLNSLVAPTYNTALPETLSSQHRTPVIYTVPALSERHPHHKHIVDSDRHHHDPLRPPLILNSVSSSSCPFSTLQCVDSSSAHKLPAPRPYPGVKMAIPGYCHHSFTMIKSPNTLLLWRCGICQSGPHWFIFECKYCKLKTCRECTFHA